MPKGYSKGYRRLLKLIRGRRMELGLSQDQLAARIGQSLPWVQRAEAGKYRMHVLETVDLLRALKIDLEEAMRFIQGRTR